MINKETCWEDTYRSREIRVSSCLDVGIFTAIHYDHTDTPLTISKLTCRLSDTTEHQTSSDVSVALSPDKMELLAAHLIEMAAYQRELETRLAEHQHKSVSDEFAYSLDQKAD